MGKPVLDSAFIAWNCFHIMAIPFLRYYAYNPIVCRVSRLERNTLLLLSNVWTLTSPRSNCPASGQSVCAPCKSALLFVFSHLISAHHFFPIKMCLIGNFCKQLRLLTFNQSIIKAVVITGIFLRLEDNLMRWLARTGCRLPLFLQAAGLCFLGTLHSRFSSDPLILYGIPRKY